MWLINNIFHQNGEKLFKYKLIKLKCLMTNKSSYFLIDKYILIKISQIHIL